MIDIALLASGAVSTLIPMLKKGIDSITGTASKSLFEWISNKLGTKNKLKDFEALKVNPEDQRLQGRVESTLETILTDNPALIDQLRILVDAAKKDSITISNSKNVVTGSISAGGSVIIGDNINVNSK
ncbi:hypothetical protein BH10BAC3_BH10BAC3_11930 [soil metagenome]